MTDSDPNATYVAFLRGLNVGGHNRLSMAELRDTCSSIGWDNVRTHGASGNVVFEGPQGEADPLAADLEQAIESTYGYDVTVFVLTQQALETVIAGQPFEERDEHGATRYVAFLAEPAGADSEAALADNAHEAESFRVSGRTVYSRLLKDWLPDGTFTDVGNVLGVPATRRRWSVVERVATMMAG